MKVTKELFWTAFCGLFVGLFMGLYLGENMGFTSGFDRGQEVTSTRISRTIAERMTQNRPFYIADLETRFHPVTGYQAILEFKGATLIAYKRAAEPTVHGVPEKELLRINQAALAALPRR